MRIIAMIIRALRQAAVGIAALGLFAPPTLVSAAERPTTERSTPSTPGRRRSWMWPWRREASFPDKSSTPKVDRKPVRMSVVSQQQQVVATATTDQDGRFSIRGLQGGMYQVVAGPRDEILSLVGSRHGSARQLGNPRLLVAGGLVVRGQRGWALLADESLGFDRCGCRRDYGPHCLGQSRQGNDQLTPARRAAFRQATVLAAKRLYVLRRTPVWPIFLAP